LKGRGERMKGLISASKGMRAVLVSVMLVRGTIKKITIIYSVSVGVVSLDVTDTLKADLSIIY
jgi:predicted exporter